MAPTILFNITHGFQARMLLRTTLADHLIAAGCRIVVVSPNTEEPYFASEFNREGYTLVPMPERFSRIESFLIKIRQYLLMSPRLAGTLHFKRERFQARYPVRAALIRFFNLFLGNIPPLRNLYLYLEKKLFNGGEFDALLRTAKPDLVVSGTPGFNAYDTHLLRAAARLGLPTATVMLSWDNLTSKGYMGAFPDNLLVWSPVMEAEARNYHRFRGPVYEVGAAHFDLYAQLDRVQAGRAFRRRHELPAEQPLIVFGTINQDIYPGQLGVLESMVARLPEIAPDARLWVRLHPQTVSGPHAHLKPAYEALAGDRVHIEIPPVRSEKLAWDLPKEDMTHLSELLAAADLVIIPRSTLSIDAACSHTPVVNLAIDPDFARGFNYTHYAGLLTCKGVRVVHSYSELDETVRAYLADPELDAQGRAAIVSRQLGRYFGRSAARTAEVLLALSKDRVP